jgi:hypothetical protein
MAEPVTPPALPLWERIAAVVAVKLATIAAGADYFYTVSDVARPSRTGTRWAPKDKGIRILQGNPRILKVFPGNPPLIDWDVPFQLDLVVAIPDASTDPVDQVLSKMARDANKAMLADPYWSTGTPAAPLAWGTRLDPENPVLYADPEEGLEGVTLQYLIRCRTTENDLSVQA